MQNSKDPRFSRPGNRLFRTAAQQRQNRTKISTTLIGIAITILFVGGGAAFYWASLQGTTPSAPPPPAATPAPVAEATSATLGQVVAATPSPAPTPEARQAQAEPTREPAARPKATHTRPRVKTAAPVKEVKASRRTLESRDSDGEAGQTRTRTASSERPPREKSTVSTRNGSGSRGTVRAKSAPRPEAAKKSSTARTSTENASVRKKSSETSEETVVVPVSSVSGEADVPVSAPSQRPRFNMRPVSERSASTARVERTEEFPTGPESQPAVPTKSAPQTKRKTTSTGDAPSVPTVPLDQ